MVTSDDSFVDTISVIEYVTSVNPNRAASEQHIRDLQEERWKTLEQVKARENIIAIIEIYICEAAQLRELYIIKPERDIFILQLILLMINP